MLLDKAGRRPIQVLGFAVMAAMFLLIGLIPGVTANAAPFIVLYRISYLFTEFGPNTTTFVYPAEIFPVEVRTTGACTPSTQPGRSGPGPRPACSSTPTPPPPPPRPPARPGCLMTSSPRTAPGTAAPSLRTGCGWPPVPRPPRHDPAVLNWADRALLATLLGAIPKARRHGLRLLVTPDTMLRWHRDIVRRRWAARSMRGRPGRPATRLNIKTLVLRLARENPRWGYRRIHGELASLGVKIAASTVREILKKAGIDPAPHQSVPTWPQFLRSQAEAILACDFFTADLLDGTQACVPAVIEHATRRIPILRVTLHPSGEWTAQQARNLIMDLGAKGHRVKFMIHDRGSNYTAAFDAVLAGAGIRTVSTRSHCISKGDLPSARRATMLCGGRGHDGGAKSRRRRCPGEIRWT